MAERRRKAQQNMWKIVNFALYNVQEMSGQRQNRRALPECSGKSNQTPEEKIKFVHLI